MLTSPEELQYTLCSYDAIVVHGDYESYFRLPLGTLLCLPAYWLRTGPSGRKRALADWREGLKPEVNVALLAI